MTLRVTAFLFIMSVNTAVAQPTVSFNNANLASSSSHPDRLVRFPDGAPVVGTNFMAVLLYGASESSLTPALPPARFRVPTTMAPGTWQGGDRTLTGIPQVPGTVVAMRVDVFDIGQFPSYDAAAVGGGILGSSALFTYIVPSLPGHQFAWDISEFSGFTVVPEPSVIVLATAGAFVFWTVKCRKRD